MRAMRLLAESLAPAVDLVYPPRCPLCGAAIGAQTGLCTDYWATLRIPGEPLVWAGLPMDRLTAGWGYDLTAQATRVDMPPPAAEEVSWDGLVDAQVGEAWRVDGGVLGDQEHFE